MPCSLAFDARRDSFHAMRDLLILVVHLVVTFAKLLRPGGTRSVVAESLTLKHQLLISNRGRRRAPNLTSLDRFVLGITTLFVNPRVGYVRIAQQISHAFGLNIDKDVVRRVLAKHYHPGNSQTNGPSWMTLIGHAKDSLWSVDL